MITILNHKRKSISIFLTAVFAFQLIGQPVAFALTSGPSQPEVQSFQPAGTSDMVDLFSGDFSYNIPLFELPGPNGGYPFNLAYQAGVGMDQEASWVGLGWNLNPGAITRQMRGLPDEFNGDPVFTKMSIDANVTVGLGAGASLEVFGSDNASLNVGFSVSHNNFKGVGYSIDGSIGYSKTNANGISGGIGLNMSLDSKEGVNVSPSLSLGGEIGEFGLSVGYNSKSGLSNLSFSHDYVLGTSSYAVKNSRTGEVKTKSRSASVSQSSSLTLAHPGYTPQITMPMRSVNISATFKAGGAWWGIFGSPYVTGFYNEQWLKDDKKRIQAPAYGYLNYQNVTDAKALLDFNREKDGMVTKEIPNLGIPSLSYDIYSVSGQGISAMYRPMRNDYGIVHDQETTSKSTSGGVGVDIGPPAHVGVNLSINHAKSTSGPWTDNNQFKSSATFQKKNVNDAYEPWYFKVHGETSSENVQVLNKLGGEKAVRVRLTGSNISSTASTTLENKTWNQPVPASSSSNRERKERTQVIQPVTNGELLSGSEEILPHFKIDYVDNTGEERPYNRESHPKHHVAGFTALTPEGLRYNYGLPAYNSSQEEVTFSAKKQAGEVSRVNAGSAGNGDPSYAHSDTDKFLKRVELPAYTHAHLLTSIVGPDYVDITNNGVSHDDLGYWVKFTYKNTTSSEHYKWRDPFSKAHLQEGWKTDPRDDKGSFVYGEKEVWYLVKAETKSHISEFTLEEREDARGVNAKLQDSDATGKSVYALKEVKLFSRFARNAVPIKVVKFDYDYTLCPSVHNSASGLGKLTLKKVWFEYGASERGRLNPYSFTYHSKNPAYDLLASDRWGNYKPYPVGEPYYNHDFPYSEQDPSEKQQIDENVAAWSLKEIQLPSGATVIVDYESDDYAYVQHKQAMQMTEIVNPYVDPASVTNSGEFNLDYENTKVRFKLERPISGVLTTQQQKAEVLKYLDQVRKTLYFKLKINLRSPSEDFHEFISGYADIDFAQPMALETVGDEYIYGFFYVKKESGSHPFSVRVWQHLRTNQPELANSGRKLKQSNSSGERVNQIKSLGSIVSQVKQMFGGFNNFCKNKDWGKEVVAGKSWIRLNAADKVKYGGGLRVRQITMKDEWAHDKEGIYGQIYEYTTIEGKQIISSGVASYEPIIGGDENSLRYAKKYVQAIPLRSDNNLFFEYPINESYYPGAQVGYGKVTVLSLASAHLAGKEVKNIDLQDGNGSLFPQVENVSYGTTGMTVHEFYTAREFPVITDETEKENKPYKLPLMIPFIGSINISKLTASQGYSIVTNDMHGRQKKVSNYRQDVKGKFEPNAISWVRYNYASTQRLYEQEKVFNLTNTFKDNGDQTLSLASAAEVSNPAIQKFTVGQENEFFADMRQYEDKAWSGGVRFQIDFLFIIFGVIPVPVPWPTLGKTTNTLRTAVTNKIIFKTGVLESVEAFDGGSLVATKNLKWDKLTGATVLTVVNNNFDEPIYSYTIPAYKQYQGMGAAYRNIGLTFSISNLANDPYRPELYQFSAIVNSDKLYEGDELLLFPAQGEMINPVARVVYTGEESGIKKIHSAIGLTETSYQCLIIRSGYRNQLSVSAGSITALQDPSKPGLSASYNKVISIPVEQ
jgi:hypothetical protein